MQCVGWTVGAPPFHSLPRLVCLCVRCELLMARPLVQMVLRWVSHSSARSRGWLVSTRAPSHLALHTILFPCHSGHSHTHDCEWLVLCSRNFQNAMGAPAGGCELYKAIVSMLDKYVLFTPSAICYLLCRGLLRVPFG